jgi:hypothetical protein
MKKFFLIACLVIGCLSVKADEHRGHYRGWSWHPSVSFYYGAPYAYPYYYAPPISYSYPYNPGYGYDYGYSRPNYAVNGTLSGALVGGIIGDSIHHQGWEGAGIGAAAGLLLGSIAESSARRQEQAPYRTQYAPQVPIYQNPPPQQIPRAPEPPPAPAWSPQITATNATYYWTAPPTSLYQIPDAPRVPDAPQIPNPGAKSNSTVR